MRIYRNPFEAVREVERDLWEMGIDVHPQTMQDKVVADNPDYATKEVQAYGFKINGWRHRRDQEQVAVEYVLTGKLPGFDAQADAMAEQVVAYIDAEFQDRVSCVAMNPGNSYNLRPSVWNEFLHDGRFAYTYSERIAPQLTRIIRELKDRPDTRQAIVNIHSNICPQDGEYEQTDHGVINIVEPSLDMMNMGGTGRIPCSLYYQFMRRAGRLDMVYAMRSCDFLTHFPVDIALALRMQNYVANATLCEPGLFTYFTGSLHAYAKDMRVRGIF